MCSPKQAIGVIVRNSKTCDGPQRLGLCTVLSTHVSKILVKYDAVKNPGENPDTDTQRYT